MRKQLGVALCGGGIKAYCQIGALRYLTEQNIKMEAFAGTSMGSIIATFMALGVPIQRIQEQLLKIEKTIIDEKLLAPTNAQVFPVLTRTMTGLVDPSRFVQIVEDELSVYHVKMLRDVKYPLIIVAVDLISGKLVYFTNRKEWIKPLTSQVIIQEDVSIVDALRASCSFPMVFETMELKDMQLVDGGILMNLPVLPLKEMGFKQVFSVSMENINTFEKSKHVTEIGARIVELMTIQTTVSMMQMADFNLNVFDKKIGIFSFGQGEAAINLGYQRAKEESKHILALNKRSFLF